MHVQSNAQAMPAPHSRALESKRYAWPLVPMWILSPALCAGLAVWTGVSAWYWLPVLVTYIVFPILDMEAFVGRDTRNPRESDVAKLEADRYYTRLLYLTVPCHYVTLFVGAWAVGTQELSVLSYVGLAWSCGIMNGYGIGTAHELGHKKSATERWMAKLTLAAGFYGQYMIDHNRGHHRDVATPGDSGSARFGEGFWEFMILRQIPHSDFSRPWKLEKERLARKGKGPWTLENEFIQPALISLSVYGLIAWMYGWVVVPYLLATAFVTYFFLAAADFIEHYGLLRQKLPDGRYEHVRPEHSWNTDHAASNLFFWNVQRHSDHHAWPTRRYQSLRSYRNLPEMPTGYPGMFSLVLFFPLWRRIMYPRLLAFHGHDLTKMNVEPRRREALMRQYHRPTAPVATVDAAEGAAHLRQGHVTTAAAGSAPRYQCPGCGYVYDEARGDAQQGFLPGTLWARIPASWQCPDCAVREKPDFLRVSG